MEFDYHPAVNEPIVEVIVGILLALSAGVRTTMPLLAVALLAYAHKVALPSNLDWIGSDASVILLGIACVTETIIHFIPALGTYLKAIATPLAFVAGTLLMAMPLSHHNPLYQWTLAAVVGGGSASLTNLGLAGARVASSPANVASLGSFGVAWNIGEMILSGLLALLGGICVVVGLVAGTLAVLVLFAIVIFALVRVVLRFRPGRRRVPVAATA